MWWIFQIVSCIVSVNFVSQFYTKEIIDFGHRYLPIVDSRIPHLLSVGLSIIAIIYDPKKSLYFVQTVYAPAMFKKALLLPFTILPDANPECYRLDLFQCLTRNDMLPSGHMILAMTAAQVIDTWPAYFTTLFIGLTLISSKMHYSVDVILAIIFTVK